MTPQRHASCYHLGYSLTCDEYDSLLKRAAGACELCDAAAVKLSIDHDHGRGGTWAVRGLVCTSCNQYLRYVDGGALKGGERVARYLAAAWHLTQDTTKKQARVRPRGHCTVCGKECAMRPTGSPYRHWSRLPGMHNTICPGRPGAKLPKRPDVSAK